MDTIPRLSESASPGAPLASCGTLPRVIRLLSVAAVESTLASLRGALAGDGAVDVAWQAARSSAECLAALRSESIDALAIVHEPGPSGSTLDALALIEGLRASGSELPILLLTANQQHGFDALGLEAGADDCCSLVDTTARGLLWRLGLAIEARRTARDYRRLLQAERQRLLQEHADAQRLLDQQRLLLDELEQLRSAAHGEASTDVGVASEGEPEGRWPGALAPSRETCGDCDGSDVGGELLSESLVVRYGELLRSYVILGTGGPRGELRAMAESLASADISARRTMQMHLESVEAALRGLGRRSTRHVMSRAELLAVELLAHLADSYRQRYHDKRHPLVQQLLPGFDPFAESFVIPLVNATTSGAERCAA